VRFSGLECHPIRISKKCSKCLQLHVVAKSLYATSYVENNVKRQADTTYLYNKIFCFLITFTTFVVLLYIGDTRKNLCWFMIVVPMRSQSVKQSECQLSLCDCAGNFSRQRFNARRRRQFRNFLFMSRCGRWQQPFFVFTVGYAETMTTGPAQRWIFRFIQHYNYTHNAKRSCRVCSKTNRSFVGWSYNSVVPAAKDRSNNTPKKLFVVALRNCSYE